MRRMRVTAELRSGDTVRLAKGVIRTVATVGRHSDPLAVNQRGERLWTVTYAEPANSRTCLASSWWTVETNNGNEAS